MTMEDLEKFGDLENKIKDQLNL